MKTTKTTHGICRMSDSAECQDIVLDHYCTERCTCHSFFIYLPVLTNTMCLVKSCSPIISKFSLGSRAPCCTETSNTQARGTNGEATMTSSTHHYDFLKSMLVFTGRSTLWFYDVKEFVVVASSFNLKIDVNTYLFTARSGMVRPHLEKHFQDSP